MVVGGHFPSRAGRRPAFGARIGGAGFLQLRHLAGEEVASVTLTNSLKRDASCMVTCKFSTTRYGNNPQITCAKPVPAGKEVEMCRLTSGGDKMVKLIEGYAECTR